MKMHNKFNKEIFIMVSIIKSKAPEPDYNSSFWNVFTFFFLYLLLSCEHFMIILGDDWFLLYIMNAMGNSRRMDTGSLQTFQTSKLYFWKAIED